MLNCLDETYRSLKLIHFGYIGSIESCLWDIHDSVDFNVNQVSKAMGGRSSQYFRPYAFQVLVFIVTHNFLFWEP
jgi:hypothetical protein